MYGVTHGCMGYVCSVFGVRCVWVFGCGEMVFGCVGVLEPFGLLGSVCILLCVCCGISAFVTLAVCVRGDAWVYGLRV